MWTERPWLHELLVCPDHGRGLTADDDVLQCELGHSFPIVGGIPRFTPASSYADNFGFEWTRFPRIQLDDETSTESSDSFRRRTGFAPEDLQGKLILDGGCGMGRFADVAARWGGRVVGVDISAAVDAAAGNLEGYANVALTQADLRRLPFAHGTFDIVFSLGVLHHTPDTFQSMSRLAALAKPGGILSIWVYSSRLRWTLAGGELLRPLTRRMDPQTLLRTVDAVVPRAHALKQRAPRFARYVDLVVPTSNHPHPDWRILDTFDWYSPRYQWKHTYPEVEGWFHRLGFVEVERQDFPVSVRGRKPLGSSQPAAAQPDPRRRPHSEGTSNSASIE